MPITAVITAQLQVTASARFALSGDSGGQPSSGAGLARRGVPGAVPPDVNVDGMLFGQFTADIAAREIHLGDPADPFTTGGSSITQFGYVTLGKVLRVLRIRNTSLSAGQSVDLKCTAANFVSQWNWVASQQIARIFPGAEYVLIDPTIDVALTASNSYLSIISQAGNPILEATFMFGPVV
jgi:hypothetical protein